jgi:hypothetical protein
MLNNFFSKILSFMRCGEIYITATEGTDDNIILRTRFACWLAKATDTHSEYVTLTAFSLQKWLQEHASMLSHIYDACLVLVLV